MHRALFVAGAALLVACAPEAIAPPVMDNPVPERPGTPTTPAVEIRQLDLTLFGSGRTTDWAVQTPQGESRSTTSTLVGSTANVPVGMPRDTTLQYMFEGAPAVGTTTLAPQSVEVMHFGGMPMLVHRQGDEHGHTAGTPRMMLFIWPPYTSAPVREIVQATAATVVVDKYVAPSVNGSDGRVVGHLEFTGDEWAREWSADGSATLRKTGAQVRVRATFDLPWEHRVRQVEVPGPG